MAEAVAEIVESQSPVTPDTENVQSEEEVSDDVADGKAYLDRLTERRAARQPKTEELPAPAGTSVLLDPRAGQYIQDYRNRAVERQQGIDSLVSDLEEFVPAQILKATKNELKGILNAHHSDGLRLSGYEAAATAVQYEQTHIQDAIAGVLPAAQLRKLSDRMQNDIKANGVATYADTFKHLVSLARDGYVDQDTYARDIKKAFDDGHKNGKKASGQVDNSNMAAGRLRGAAPEPSSNLKPTSLAEATGLHARGLITNSQMAAYKAQFK